MKKFILLLGVLALGFTSCSKKSENLKIIPKDAMVVVSFDLQSLYQKADVEELQQLKSFQKLKEEISNDNKEIGKIFNEILKDPKSSGVDFKKNAFFFVCDSKKYGGDSRNPYIGVTAVLSDDAKFKDLLNRVSQATKLQLDIKKEGALNIVYFNEGASLSWDNKKMLFLVNDNYSTRVDVVLKKLYEQSKSEQITDIKGFSDFLDGQKDINVWLNLGGFMQDDSMFLNGIAASLYKSLFNMQKDSYFYGFIDFGKDDIKLTTYSIYNQETAKLLKKYDLYDISFDKDILKNFPEKLPIAIGGAVNVKNYYEFLKAQFGKELNEDDLVKLLNTQGLTKDNVLNFFGGSFMLAIEGFENQKYISYDLVEDEQSEDGYEYKEVEKERMFPVFGLSFNIGDKTLLDKGVALAHLALENGYYKLPLQKDLTLYFAYNNKAFYGSNSPKGVEAFLKGGVSNNAVKSDFGKHVSKDLAYFYMSLEPKDYPQEYVDIIREKNSREGSLAFDLFIQHSTNIECKRIDNSSAEFIYHLKGIEKNSLNTFFKSIDKVINYEN
ncbi:DUF4836 family protein [Capnocytophaga genosp. AHN8471]|uniref:DUF4836 family protein n=1 Tax=Capnocytophaga genosp. AHN8471 TaxID=327574 RepID=A0ABS1YTK1_9FLAO|nr:DUF4836 family protein [Capnocytophaga genosp. AHN8471]MBM0649413.1 DUF4836 family protein [Capnocytophaga genosp. AHN8471]MBM0661241.1 DUF4836 family protein [Capnocytophaga genosp. AHN8471]